MTDKHRRWVGVALSAVLLLSAFHFIQKPWKKVTESEQDMYFYLSLAREVAQHGIARSVPQAEDLGWKNDFIEKNFLFTELMGLAYWIGQEKGARVLAFGLAGAILFSVFWITAEMLGSLLPAFGLAFIPLLFPRYMNRLVLLRPHLLGIFLFLMIVYGLLKKRKWWVGTFSFLFALSYHILFIPFLAFLLYLPSAFGKDRAAKRSLIFGILGLLLGIRLNPLFPNNLPAIWNAITIALNTPNIDQVDRATEFITYSASDFITNFFFFIGALFLCWIVTARNLPFKRSSRKKEWKRFLLEWFRDERGFLCGIALLFWGMAAVNPRAKEYAEPVTLLLVAAVISRLTKTRLQAWAAVGLLLMTAVPGFIKTFLSPLNVMREPVWLTAAIARLPKEASGRKVLNCQWHSTPELLYRRPDLKFVDISDPVLLLDKNPRLYTLRNRLRKGKVAYPYGVVRYAFRANYVLCEDADLVMQMERDPHFRRLFPDKLSQTETWPAGFPYLYEVRDTPISNLITQYDVAMPTAGTVTDWKRAELSGQKALSQEQKSPFLDLYRWEYEEKGGDRRAIASSGTPCRLVRPTPQVIAEKAGTTWLGIGGGPRVKVWLNGEHLYYTEGVQHPFPRLVHSLIPLSRPLNPRDTLEALVCPQPGYEYLGLSFSFWKLGDLQNVCHEKKTPFVANPGEAQWAFSPDSTELCFSSVVPGVSRVALSLVR